VGTINAGRDRDCFAVQAASGRETGARPGREHIEVMGSPAGFQLHSHGLPAFAEGSGPSTSSIFAIACISFASDTRRTAVRDRVNVVDDPYDIYARESGGDYSSEIRRDGFEFPRARREMLLDELERSGGSAQFAGYVGIKYSTLANRWPTGFKNGGNKGGPKALW
jgi:hypothetical protein